MAKNLSALEQVLVDTIKKSTSVGGDIYDASKGAIAKGIEFAQQQIPDIIHQLLMWNLAEAGVFIAISFGLMYVAYWASTEKPVHETGGSSYLLTIVAGFVSAIMFIRQLLTIIKILIAPKIWLIEYASQLVR